jgi:hypothetical protein
VPAIGQNITQWQGDSRIISFPVTDALGNNVDLSGASARWWVGKTAFATGTDIYVEKSTASGGGMTLENNAGLWSVVITLVPTDTENVAAGRWYHECEVIDAAGNVARVLLGKFIMNPSLIPASLG